MKPPAPSAFRPGTTSARRVRWRRHRYPEQFINRRQEMVIAILFGLIGLFLTAMAFLYSDSLMCALGEWSRECAEMLPPPSE
ncbi:MAG TPA: hypothetical protein VFD92_13600 [Candidatus Binatia bacterium]|nr:hypothetical protein [Candidatus Binatia bacterium]